MIGEAVEYAGSEGLEELTAVIPGDVSVTAEDQGISAQARSLPDLDWMLDRLAQRDPRRRGGLLDLGCGMGALTAHIAARLGLTLGVGDPAPAQRLKGAAARGIRPLLLDLNSDRLPLASGSVRLVTCFGVLAYLSLYDNVLSESARVLEDGGWLLLSMPNLGSYVNRMSLLLGYQPHVVAVSRFRQAGTRGRRRDPATSANMPPLLHGATLRCMDEVLDAHGFDIEVVRGFSPGERRRPVVDAIASRFPALSRRFLILARKRAGS
jgi:SAM-dependent methyltransferase